MRKALLRAFNLKEIPEAFREKESVWLEAFAEFVARRSASGADEFQFVKLALDHGGIENPEKRERFARLFNEHKALDAGTLKNA